MRGGGGSIEFMKRKWKKCPGKLKGQYHDTTNGKLATIMEEVWLDRSLYVLSWFARRPGTNNYLDVMKVSPLITDIMRGSFFQLSMTKKYCRNV